MKVLKFTTNVKCGGCVATITPHLNQENGISNWNVDLDSPQRILSVETQELNSNEVVAIMQKAGFKAEAISG